MSYWRRMIRELSERGPLEAGQFMSIDASRVNDAIRTARRVGLVMTPGKRQGAMREYALTKAGWMVATGRACVVRGSGAPYLVCATWLSALPPANEIRLSRK